MELKNSRLTRWTARLLVTVVMACGACSSGPAPVASVPAEAAMDDSRVQGRVAVLTVYGMSCPLCAGNVTQSLSDVPGITNVALDLSTGEARVTLDGTAQVTRRQLAQAIEKSGFTLQSIEAK